MKTLVFVVLLVALMGSNVFAFNVPADGSITTIQVEPGLYRVYSSGTYRYDHDDQVYAIADAEWLLISDYKWYEYAPLDPEQKICDLTINGSFFDWRGLQTDGQFVVHTFSATHEYMVELYLDGNTDFQIYDPLYYYDNSGSLEVIVAPVPEPSSIFVLCGGVVGFLAFRRRRK